MTSGLFNCYESAADVRPTDEDTWLSRQKLSCIGFIKFPSMFSVNYFDSSRAIVFPAEPSRQSGFGFSASAWLPCGAGSIGSEPIFSFS